jgi:hypothetical protein
MACLWLSHQYSWYGSHLFTKNVFPCTKKGNTASLVHYYAAVFVCVHTWRIGACFWVLRLSLLHLRMLLKGVLIVNEHERAAVSLLLQQDLSATNYFSIVRLWFFMWALKCLLVCPCSSAFFAAAWAQDLSGYNSFEPNDLIFLLRLPHAHWHTLRRRRLKCPCKC